MTSGKSKCSGADCASIRYEEKKEHDGDHSVFNLPSLCESSLEDTDDALLSSSSTWDDDSVGAIEPPFTQNQNEQVPDDTKQYLPTTITTTNNAVNTPMSLAVLGLYRSGERPVDDKGKPNRKLSSLQKNQIMVRRRANSKTETVSFDPEQGDAESKYYHVAHKDWDCGSRYTREILSERAILLQPIEHYQKLRESPETSRYFASSETKEFDENEILNHPSFGEQVIISGCDASTIRLGDILVDEEGTLEIEVSSPRLCGARVDKRNGSPYGTKGVKAHCNSRGLGGMFGRVIVGGELREGTNLVRIASPHPNWPLEKVSKALYGDDRPKNFVLRGWPHWSLSKEELIDLCRLGPDVLGQTEWKEEADYILQHWSKYFPSDEFVKDEDENNKDKEEETDWACSASPGIEWLEPMLSTISPSFYQTLGMAWDVACNGCCAAYLDSAK